MSDFAIGKRVIIRTYSAGVHYGTLVKQDGKEVVLSNARRIWYWKGAFTLSEIANAGLKEGSKLSDFVPEVLLTEAIETIPCTDAAVAILDGFKAYVS